MGWWLRTFVAVFLVFQDYPAEAGDGYPDYGDEEIIVPGERPFDEVNIFGNLGRIFRLPDTEENKIWWERMVRGQVGQDRFLILCALKDGNWKKLSDIRNFIEFQTREINPGDQLHKLLLLMAGRKRAYTPSGAWRLNAGEGWLERNLQANYSGNDSEWCIEPSVLPLLYFLLMGCPEENRCE